MRTTHVTSTDRILWPLCAYTHKLTCSPPIGMKRHSLDRWWFGLFFMVRPRHCFLLVYPTLSWCHLRTPQVLRLTRMTRCYRVFSSPVAPNLLPGLLACMDVSGSRRERRASPSVAGCQAGVSVPGASFEVGGASSPLGPSYNSIQRETVVFGFRVALPHTNVFSPKPHNGRFHVNIFRDRDGSEVLLASAERPDSVQVQRDLHFVSLRALDYKFRLTGCWMLCSLFWKMVLALPNTSDLLLY